MVGKHAHPGGWLMPFFASPRLARRPRSSGPPRCLAAGSLAARSAAWRPAREGKTLDDVDEVVVAAVDNPGNPKSVQVYQFGAAEVKARFDAAYAARKKAGLNVKNDFGM